MAKEASEIQSSTLQKRLPVEGTDELGRLARTFNELLDRIEIAYRKLEENYEIQTRFTANASHELRTPLTVIRGRAELALSSATTVDQFQKSMQIVLNSAQSMSTLVEDLLLLARSDAGHLLPNKKYVDICRIFEEATIGVTDRHIEFHYGVTWVLADSDQLIRVISNLVLNAQRHTSTGGTINLRTWKGEGGVNLSVTDDGEGISENHLQHIFERFYRADASRGHSNGSGLGLAICQEIVEAHGGNIKVGALQDRGLQFTVFLPDNGKVDFEPKTGE
jgi:signal transduction histidine kinase